MRFSAVVAVLGAAASVSASAIVARQLPDCATTCLASADYGTCSRTQVDNACLCRSEPFITSATACITSTCQGPDLQTALTLAQAMCAAEGVTLTPPSATGGTQTTPAATTGTSTGTTAPTTTAPSTTTGANGAAQTTSGAITHGLSSLAALAAIAVAAVSL